MAIKPYEFTEDIATLPDQGLLEQFVRDADTQAFTQIVQRYQSLVMSVCHRVLGRTADADDAFQATFLALALRPHSIRQCRSLTAWLYAVAFRTSQRLIRVRKRKAMLPIPDGTPSVDPCPDEAVMSNVDLMTLDEELNQLPQKYRDVLVMTCFAGQSSQQIADQLQETKGAIDGRIRQAKILLKSRLMRRGIEITAITAAISLSENVSAASPEILNNTIHLGSRLLGNVSLSAAKLAHPELLRLESLLKPELTVMTTRMIASVAVGLALSVGVISLSVSQLIADESAAETQPSGAESSTSTGEKSSVEKTAPADTKAEVAEVTKPAVSSEPESAGDVMPAATDFGGFSSINKRDTEQRYIELLAKPGPELSFPGPAPILEVLQSVSERMSESESVAIVPDQQALNDASVNTLNLADLMVTDFRAPEGMPIQDILDAVFDQTREPKLDYVIRNQRIVITTAEAAASEENMLNRVYPVRRSLEILRAAAAQEESGSVELTRPSAGTTSRNQPGGLGGGVGFGGGLFQFGGIGALGEGTETQPPQNAGVAGVGAVPDRPGIPRTIPHGPQKAEAALLELIISMTSPPHQWYDIDGEGGRISITGNMMMVRQSLRGHRAVVEVLELLEEGARQAESVR